jgi:hypothetical protein
VRVLHARANWSFALLRALDHIGAAVAGAVAEPAVEGVSQSVPEYGRSPLGSGSIHRPSSASAGRLQRRYEKLGPGAFVFSHSGPLGTFCLLSISVCGCWRYRFDEVTVAFREWTDGPLIACNKPKVASIFADQDFRV